MDEADRLRDSLLRSAWQEILAVTPDNVRNFPAANRAIGAGASVEDMVTAMRAASYETTYRLLYLLSLNHGPDVEDADVGWTVVPYDLASERPVPANPNPFAGISEDLLEADPSGRGSADLWD